MDDETRERKMARVNELSVKLRNYHKAHANVNGISGALPGSPFILWFKELTELNKELGTV